MKQRRSSDPAPRGRGLLQTLVICGLLLLAVGLVFGPTVNYTFINQDDDVCVYENPWVTNGLTAEAVKWAFTSRWIGNWDPLTWMSHMLDWELYGDDAGGHHLTNVLLHAATVVLLFLVLQRMTGRRWPSALAAALFAVHPLRAESVAWVVERKDVLSGFFFVLTLLAYSGYVRRRSVWSRCLAYLLMMLVFALGLLSKPMLVTLPCVLLLLDYWPFGRIAAADSRWKQLWLFAEKVPLLAMSAALCCGAIWAEHVEMHEPMPFAWRLSDVLISYAVYLKRTFYPFDLAPLCPRRLICETSLWTVFAAVTIFIGVTAAAWWARRKYPYLLMGWLWFLGMLVPAIGVVSFGDEVASDRFTYLPHIGLCIAVAWGAADVFRCWPRRRWICAAAALLLLAGLTWAGARQVSFWRDPLTLWPHTLECASQNFTAHRAYGNALAKAGALDRAIEQYEAAIRVKPDFAEAYYSLGVAETQRHRANEAMAYYRRAIQICPSYALARNNLGYLLLLCGEYYDAIGQFQEAARVCPTVASTHYNWGLALHALGKARGAEAEYREAIRLQPDYPEAYYNLGVIFAAERRRDDALKCFRAALLLKPDFAEARRNLDALLAAGQ